MESGTWRCILPAAAQGGMTEGDVVRVADPVRDEFRILSPLPGCSIATTGDSPAEQRMGEAGVRPESSRVPGTILFLSHDSSRTGAPIFLLNLLGWLRRNGRFDFRLLTGRPGALSPEFATVGTVDSFEPSRALWYRAMRRFRLQNWYDSAHRAHLREMFRRENVALIYANSIASARMLDFLSFVNCPVICHVHELDGAIRTIGVENLSRLEKRRPLYIAVSQAVKRSLVENHDIPGQRVLVIPGFIPLAEGSELNSAAAGRRMREQLRIREGARIVCACGSIEHRKGTDLFLQVAQRTLARYDTTPVHFIWIGGSHEKVNAMTARVESSDLRGFVHFVGHTSNTRPYLDASDVFLLTSREDPFPLVVMEAAEFGKPIICFERAGGAPEFVEADTGFVVPDFDVDIMSDRLIEMLSSPSLRDRMGKAAREKVVSRHSLQVGAAKVAATIECILQHHTATEEVSH